MRTENLLPTIEDLKNGASDVAELARDISVKAGRKLDAAYESTRRGVHQARVAVEDAVEDTRHEIKERPLTAMAVTALGAFAIGMTAGWFIAGRRRS